MSQAPASRKPSAAEWTTLILSSLVILALVAGVIWLTVDGDDAPPRIEATPVMSELRQVGGAYALPIEVTNRGNAAAQHVLVRAEVSRDDGSPESAEFTLDVLAGGETREATVVFRADPATHDLTVDVVSFQ